MRRAFAAGRPPWRRLGWWGVVAGVLLGHVWMGERWVAQGLGAQGLPPPPPIDVAFVQRLALSAPPQIQPQNRPADAPSPVAPSASAPVAEAETTASAPAETASVVASAVASDIVGSIDVAPPAESASAPAAPVFDWPPSTRLDYRLEGYRNGPLQGDARVEWRRQGDRYEVMVAVRLPPWFERRMISHGVIGPAGLMPRRYDQETQVALRDLRRATVLLTPEGEVTLANGQSAQAPAGVQDSASQFVQITWLFLTQAARLPVGAEVTLPLVLPHRVGQWVYDVVAQETVYLPIGPVEALHLKPRPNSGKPNEVSVEMWMAPQLQYLPVRLRLQQDADTHLELTLKHAPLQAAGP
jgi:hypothetical protein